MARTAAKAKAKAKKPVRKARPKPARSAGKAKATKKAAAKAAPKRRAPKEKAKPAPRRTVKAELKTKPTAVSVDAFIDAVPNATRRRDARILLELMKRVTGDEPKMWGPSIIGFGKYVYRYESGREGEMCRAGFSPRGNASVVYLMCDGPGMDALFARLGPYSMGKSCLYIKRLDDVDLGVLEEIVRATHAAMNEKFPV